jgi:acyl-homoserine-lactone acylase
MRSSPKRNKIQVRIPFNEKEYMAATVFSLSIFCGVDYVLPRILGGKVNTIPGLLPKDLTHLLFIHPEQQQARLSCDKCSPAGRGTTAFYEAHLQSEQGWNMLGGLFPGGCLIFHGTNENLGWAHTVNNPDKIDIFQLEINLPVKSNTSLMVYG